MARVTLIIFLLSSVTGIEAGMLVTLISKEQGILLGYFDGAGIVLRKTKYETIKLNEGETYKSNQGNINNPTHHHPPPNTSFPSVKRGLNQGLNQDFGQ